MKRLSSFLIAAIMLFAMLPMSASAVADYTEVSYDAYLYEDELRYDYISGTDPYYDLNIGEDTRSGYGQGYRIFLSYGSEYTITIEDSCTDATYIERSIILLRDDLSGNIDDDMITYGYNYADGEYLETWLKFTAPGTGYFYVLSLGMCFDLNDNLITGMEAQQTISVCCDNVFDYTDIEYSEKLNVGTAVNGHIDESDPFIYDAMFNDLNSVKGYNVQLEGGKNYIISVSTNNKTGSAVNIFAAFALLNDSLTGDTAADCIAKKSYYGYYEETSNVHKVIQVEETGTYKLLFATSSYSNSDEDYIFGAENTETKILIRQATEIELNIYTKQDLFSFYEITTENNIDIYNVNFCADIDMSGEEWVPITCDTVNIKGNEYAIKGMSEQLFEGIESLSLYDLDVEMNYTHNSEDYLYYKGIIAGTVYDSLYLYNCNTKGSFNINAYCIEDIAGLVADFWGDDIYVDDCDVAVDINLTAKSGVSYVGGAFAYISAEGYIGNVTYTGNMIINAGEYSYTYIGGLIGDMFDNVYMENCSAKGMILSTAPQNTDTDYRGYSIGGFVGYMEDYNSFMNCFAEVSVITDMGEDVGGFAGELDEANSFMNCYATGGVAGDEYLGGFAGNSSCCGYNKFLNCYALGDITGLDYVGGFIGAAYEGDTFINCYAAGTVTASVENAYQGGFLGEGYDGGYPITFGYCYAASEPAIGYYQVWDEGLGEYVKPEGAEIIDFKDTDAVLVMEKELNDNVQYLTENGGIFGLAKWGNRNAKGGPNLIFPCNHTYPDKFNGYDENSHWYTCTNPDCTDHDEKYMENDHVTFWVTVKEATETEDGLKKLICEKCDYCIKEEAIPKLPDDGVNNGDGFMLGDVNKNDKIDMTDYILLKRAYFGTFTFDDDQNKRGDINKNNKIDMTDYILLKRVYFGTYTIK